MTLYALQLRMHSEFARPAGGGRQQFRVHPLAVPGVQQIHELRVRMEPHPLEQHEYTDFFGTKVLEMVLPSGLQKMELLLEARVERLARPPISRDLSPPVTRLGSDLAAFHSVDGQAPHHFLGGSWRVPQVEDIHHFARAATAGCPTTLDAVVTLGETLYRAMAFDGDATTVETTASEAFALRRGVCQDFSHVMISGLRSLGIPAAYVAGYLRTLPPPGQPRLVGADAMHAWVRAWVGGGVGWIDYDPTNDCLVGADHIEVGFGRDYSDVAPVTGMLRVSGAQKGGHSVDIEAIG